MKILAVDVGTGTQDILLFDPLLDVENSFKLVLPSPTMIVHNRLKKATAAKKAVLLTGVTMGGGPSQWAAEEHARAGHSIFATPPAARTFNDDLAAVEEMGIKIVSEDESRQLSDDVVRIDLKDFDFELIRSALASFELDLEDDLAAVSVAVFDHGAAPNDVSDRKFRFDYLDERIRAVNQLSAFAFHSHEIPPIMTRLQAVAQSASKLPVPLVVMDTAPAAVLGATFDLAVDSHNRVLIVNVGNFHTLAFRLGLAGIEGVFEHHTGLITLPKLEQLILKLADGSLLNQDVFGDHGHGALVYANDPLILSNEHHNLVVTGPRRSMMFSSGLSPYFAVPFGDMMLAGCFGLLAATADLLPELAEPIRKALHNSTGSGRAPWES